MRISITATRIDVTPSLNTYIEKKLGALKKLVTSFDKDGLVELHVEIDRLTRHHKKGIVFHAEANLRLPKKVLHAEEQNVDIRQAVDILEEKLRRELEKYKTKSQDYLRASRKK